LNADLLITGGRLWAGRRLNGVDTVAVSGDRIVAIGTASDLSAMRSASTRVIDARGGTVTPGLCDAHLHLLDWARSRRELTLSATDSAAEVVERVAQRYLDKNPEMDGSVWKASTLPELWEA